MSPVPDVDPSLVVQDWTAGIHGKRQLSSRENEIEIGQHTVIGADLFNIFGSVLAQTRKDHLDLFLFFCVELFEIVVQFDACHRLDK